MSKGLERFNAQYAGEYLGDVWVIRASDYDKLESNHAKLVEALRMLLKDPNHPIVDANARTLLAQLDGELE